MFSTPVNRISGQHGSKQGIVPLAEMTFTFCEFQGLASAMGFVLSVTKITVSYEGLF
jgi:hypothetical protein